MDKSCRTCIWCDRYFDHNYGFCKEHEKWVNLDDHCNGKQEENIDERRENEKSRGKP